MKLEGSYIFSSSKEQVWRALNDPEVLARSIPGVKRLEPEGEDRYRVVIEISIGPVRGAFEGQLEVRHRRDPEELTLYVECQGGPGGVQAEGRLQLTEEEDGITTLTYTGVAKITGTLAAMGSRLLQGVVRTLSKQFFANLEREAKALEAQGEV